MIRTPIRAPIVSTSFVALACAPETPSLEGERIRSALGELTAACNACHVAEDMEFGPPPARFTTVQPLGRER